MNDDADDLIADAVDLAEELAPQIDRVLLTLYPDAETLDTLHPGETDLATANAIARAVAGVMAEAGTEVLVQRADRGAFRRWLAGREDTPATRLRWIDRDRLLRGGDAFRALGLAPPAAPPPPRFATAPGPVADQVIAAHAEGEEGEFASMVTGLIEANRQDVLDLVLRKVKQKQSDENAAELELEMLAIAEAGAFGPSGFAELVAMPVALVEGAVPDPLVLAESLSASGSLSPDEELRFLPGWRSPDAISRLSVMATRRILLDVVAGREPRDLPPADTDDLARRGFGVMIGLRLDWAVPIWDVIAEEGGDPAMPDDEDAETPEDRAREKAFERWCARVAAEHSGSVPLGPMPFSEAAGAVEAFLDEASEEFEALEEIRGAIEAAEAKAKGEEVVCHAAIVDGGLELTLQTGRGRLLGRVSLPADRLPVSPEMMVGMLAPFVRMGGRAM